MSSAVARTVSAPPVVIERPRAFDALGCSLRDAYVGECATPEELIALLRRIGEASAGQLNR